MIETIVKFVVPAFGVLGFGHAGYRVFIEKLDATNMGLTPAILKMYGIADLLMAIGWIAVLAGLAIDASWSRSIAIGVTGMYAFDYLASLPSFAQMGDKLFKYWGTASMIIFVAYCIWL